jgi:adhesin/invasin
MVLIASGAAMIFACAPEVTAPRILRVVPSIRPESLVGLFSAGAEITSNGQHASVGSPIEVTVRVIDQHDNPVPGVAVLWKIVGDGGAISTATTLADSIGNATITWTLDTIARLDSIRASILQGANATMWASGSALHPTATQKISADSQAVTVGATSLPLAFRLTDRYGNPTANIQVAWLATNGGTVSALTSRSDANGMATANLTEAPAIGTYSVIATLGILPAVTFTVTAAH